MPAADEQAALRGQCASFLTGHGPVSVADVIAGIPSTAPGCGSPPRGTAGRRAATAGR